MKETKQCPAGKQFYLLFFHKRTPSKTIFLSAKNLDFKAALMA